MSKQFLLKSFSITACGALFGYFITHLLVANPQQVNQFDFASKSPSTPLSKMNPFQMNSQYFDVRIKHESVSEVAEGLSVVKAIITAKKDLPAGLNFKWNLGKDVSSSDVISGTLPAIKENQTHEVLLSVVGFNKTERTYLGFALEGSINSHHLFKETLSSSRPEDSFEYFVQEQNRLEKEQFKHEQAGKVTGQSTANGGMLKNKFKIEEIIK